MNFLQIFITFHEKNFRLIWLSSIFSGFAQQMEAVVLAWYVLTLTDSPLLVGFVTTSRQAATLFGAFTGAIADRFSRTGIVISAQGFMASLAFVMTLLVLSENVQTWHIFVATAMTGLARIFDMPARQALVADSVPVEKVSNAVALNNSGRNLMQIAAPVTGGILFSIVGPAGSYLVLGFVYIASAMSITFIKIKSSSPIGYTNSFWTTLVQGINYVRNNKTLLAALLMAAVANLTAFPFNYALMPVYARETLNSGSSGLGLLLSGIGIGAFIGSIVVASMRSIENAGRIGIIALIGWHIMTTIVILSPIFELSFGLIMIAGIMQSMSLVLVASILLGIAVPDFRGRVMGLRSLAVYTLPIGSLITGALITQVGLIQAAVINTVLGGILIAGIVLLIPTIIQKQRILIAQE
ncbi:MAG: MFS transporter [SAR202 cluster bacterium]|nr:MFS transporter [SAR202 cluster bacterium]|tara:strand:- start:1680 stop:2912 length:1233 start_codon:yes stop_codon:yes gene_type:complete